MKILFMGCVEFSARTLGHLLTLPDVEVVGVVTKSESKINADFHSLQPIAEAAGIPCFLAEGNQQAEIAAWAAERSPDVVYCFGWSYLLKEELLTLPPLGVVGYHPAALPQNRGRHPIIWALALGLSETASTFFFMDRWADSGDLLSQVYLPILPEDDAGSLYQKLGDVALGQISVFTKQLASGDYPRIPQDHSGANTWRKRGRRDGEIDWRMSAERIHNLIRALTRPYVGAHFLWQGEEVKVWRSELSALGQANLEPGKVLRADADGVVIQCGAGALKLVKHELATLPEEGTYL
ncbi:formyl transferase [Tumebacillus algifaecis]|uniref:Formyl transferase n=1 Tax=Tumebacillus algifaecis TaxID=1214604 RepID=A0A223CXC4_9BACL|nr:formyltransferase family protein [Tumebacillus algifaecis]ASS73948.1 formyl transferase [Tumebacillus algifaecis]